MMGEYLTKRKKKRATTPSCKKCEEAISDRGTRRSIVNARPTPTKNPRQPSQENKQKRNMCRGGENEEEKLE